MPLIGNGASIMALPFFSRRTLAERLDGLRRPYGFVCWLMCVFTMVGILFSRSMHGWVSSLYLACFIGVMILWVDMSILLLCRAVIRWARGGRSPGLARRTGLPVPLRVPCMIVKPAYDPWPAGGMAPGGELPEAMPRYGLPMRRGDNLPGDNGGR